MSECAAMTKNDIKLAKQIRVVVKKRKDAAILVTFRPEKNQNYSPNLLKLAWRFERKMKTCDFIPFLLKFKICNSNNVILFNNTGG